MIKNKIIILLAIALSCILHPLVNAQTDPTLAPVDPTLAPVAPTEAPVDPTEAPVTPTEAPVDPTEAPVDPTEAPVDPTEAPVDPTEAPVDPTEAPIEPTTPPTPAAESQPPTEEPLSPTTSPSEPPTTEETGIPSASPTASPTEEEEPTDSPSANPTASPTEVEPTDSPSEQPSEQPSESPSAKPTGEAVSDEPSAEPSAKPTGEAPSDEPSAEPSASPTASPSDTAPSASPTASPSDTTPSASPTASPSDTAPSSSPSVSPPTEFPTNPPTPTPPPSLPPVVAPTDAPVVSPTDSPTDPPVVPTMPISPPTTAPITPTIPISPPTAAPIAPTESPTVAPVAPTIPTETVILLDQQNIYNYNSELVFPESGVYIDQMSTGNLVLYRGLPGSGNVCPIWETGAYDTSYSVYYTRLQRDGNMLTRPGYTDEKPRPKSIWSTWSKGDHTDYYFALSADQSLVYIKRGTPEFPGEIVWSQKTKEECVPTAPIPKPAPVPVPVPVPTRPIPKPTFYPDTKDTILLGEKEDVLSSDGPLYIRKAGVYLVQKKTGTFVIYTGKPGNFKVLWKTDYDGKKYNYYTRVQGDGNFVTKPGSPDDKKKFKSVWKSDMTGNKDSKDYYLFLSSDHKKIYVAQGKNGNKIIWSDKTKKAGNNNNKPKPRPRPTPSKPIKKAITILKSKDVISSTDGVKKYKNSDVTLEQKQNGMLILSYGNKTLWKSGYKDGNKNKYYTRLSKSGNLGTFTNKKDKQVWSTDSKGPKDTYYWVLSKNMKTLSIHKGSKNGKIVWSVKTSYD